MEFGGSSRRKQVTLRGASKHETTRAEDLNRAKEERAARQAAKRQQSAALTIQRAWRGAVTRNSFRRQLCRDWLKSYGTLVLQPDELLPPKELEEHVLPPILLAYRLPCSNTAPGTVPIPATLLQDTSALRGALALTLRSLGMSQAEKAFFALALYPDSRSTLLSQLQRLSALCCSVLGAPGCDLLTQAAAARVLSLLADASKWRSHLSSDDNNDDSNISGPTGASLAVASAGVVPVTAGVSQQFDDGSFAPIALQWLREQWFSFLAASRMVVLAVQRLAELTACSAARADSDTGDLHQKQAQQVAAGTGSSLPSQQLTSMQNSLITTQLRLWQQLLSPVLDSATRPTAIGRNATFAQAGQQLSGQPTGPSTGSGLASKAEALDESSNFQMQPALPLLVTHVLTLPSLLPSLSPAVVTQLTQPSTFVAILNCVAAVASRKLESSNTTPDAAGAVALDPGEALWLLANLTGLLAGKKVRQQSKEHAGSGGGSSSSPGASNKAVEFLPTSPLLKAGGRVGVGVPFAVAADALLCRASSGSTAGFAAGEALRTLWPFAEGTFAAQLLSVLPTDVFCHLFHTLLLVLDAAGGAKSLKSDSRKGQKQSNSSGAVNSARVLDALAFATPLLPQLWKWLGLSVGVPLEAPLQAKRGWDIHTLNHGICSVAPEAAEALGLFCRIYARYLMVSDDYDFHEKQPLFTLGQQRAIATTLNTLVFRTHLPALPQHVHQVKAAAGVPLRQYSGKGLHYNMLEVYAPVLLRSMYERDARRPYCPPSLWLEPYHNSVEATASLAQSTALQPASPVLASTGTGAVTHAAATSHGHHHSGGAFRSIVRGLTGRRSRGGSCEGAGTGAGGEQLSVEEQLAARWLGGSGERSNVDQSSDGAAGAPLAGVVSGFSAAAVVRALLHTADSDAMQRQGEEASADIRHARQAQQQHPQLPGILGLAVASQPSALAAILVAAPQCVPFEERVAVFRALIDMDKERGGYNLAPVDGGPLPLPVTIRRSHVLEDALVQLPRGGEGMKRRLYVTFVNEQGLQEAGVDMGGLMKELVETLVTSGFDRNRGLFSSTPDSFAYPNPLAEKLEGGLTVLELLGSVLGKALYEGILVDMPLAPFFVSRLQGRWPLFDELSALDPEVYHSLIQLKRYEGDAEDLALDFTVETDAFGARMCEELVPGGSTMPVTSSNMLQYVYLMADWHLNKRLGVAANAFGRGLSKIIPPSWLRLFSPREVNQLLGGGDGGEIDVRDMRRYVQYSGGYSESSSAVRTFWKVLDGLGQPERRALLKFVTSCSRAPLGGFRHLNPPLTIHKVDCDAAPLALFGGKDVERLPTASTCYNMLKLPNYRRAATMREKLLYAIRSGAGFELS